MYELYVKTDAETVTPPDFMLYCFTNQVLPLGEVSKTKFSVETDDEGIYRLNYFGLKSEITITEVSKLTKNHYQLTVYIRFKLPFFYGSAIGVLNFLKEGNRTLCYGGGSEKFPGISGKIVKNFHNKISNHFIEIWVNLIEAYEILWTDAETSKKYFSEEIIERINNKASFDDLLDLKMASQLKETSLLDFIKQKNGEIRAGDLSIFLGGSLKSTKEKLNTFIENGDCEFDEANNVSSSN